MEVPSFNDLVFTITKDQDLWNEFRVALRKNDIVTNVASKEYLFHFINQNKEYSTGRYFDLNSSKKKNAKVSTKRENNDASTNYGKIKRRLSSALSKRNSLGTMILHNCKHEVVCYA